MTLSVIAFIFDILLPMLSRCCSFVNKRLKNNYFFLNNIDLLMFSEFLVDTKAHP